jgi:hypothetical protein
MNISARRLLKRRPLSFAIATLALALSPAFTPAPSAKTSNGCTWYQSNTYYTDASYTTATGGFKVYYCDGLIWRYGTQTSYYTTDYCDCVEDGGK